MKIESRDRRVIIEAHTPGFRTAYSPAGSLTVLPCRFFAVGRNPGTFQQKWIRK